jgi:hypothetical protein
MECSFLRENDPSWDEFVIGHPSGTFFHLLAWREIRRKSFGYEPVYLWIRDSSGRIRGLLPLFVVKSMLFGRSLVAMPVGVYGGPLASDEESYRMLLQQATELAKERHVRYLEIRGNPYADAPIAPPSTAIFALVAQGSLRHFQGPDRLDGRGEPGADSAQTAPYGPPGG